MSLIVDGLLIAGAAFAGTYCYVLSRRVRALKDLDRGVGGAIMRMSQALEEARRALDDAKAATREGNRDLKELIARADAASGQLRILLAATRDLPPPAKARGEAQAPSRGEAQAPSRGAAQASSCNEGSQSRADDPGEESRGSDWQARRQLRGAPALSAPPLPARSSAPLDRERAARQQSPLRPRRADLPPSEDDLLAALADFATGRG